MIAQTEVSVNVCIFIDALDEHDGNHSKLIDILHQLSKNNGMAKIKLCLASRPEPIFQLHFGECPGFAIHDYTEKDVHK